MMMPGAVTDASFLGLPTELRLKIYEHFYDDLIEELSDNLFGVFQLYDNMYDYTASYLMSHVGKTGLTVLLTTCKQVYHEALAVLCEKATFLVNIVSFEDSDDQERASIRFSDGSRRLQYAKSLRVNFLPADETTVDLFIGRVTKFLDDIGHGVELRSLEIFLEPQLPAPDAAPLSAKSVERVLEVLATLKTAGSRIKVHLGDIGEEVLSDEKYTGFLDTIDGDGLGRDQEMLQPTYWEEYGEGEEEHESY